MKNEMKFTPIDLQTWPRGQIFYYFSKMAPTGYSLTVDLDITKMRTALQAAKLKFFPAYLWLVTKTLNLQQEFKIAEKDLELRGSGDFFGTRQSGKTLTDIKNLRYSTAAIFLAKRLCDEVFEGRLDSEELRVAAMRKYDALKDVVMN